jgi:predicted DNA-binding transcriptional regulator AlpA
MQLLTKQQVAERIGIHPESVMRLARAGRFPRPIKIGGDFRCAVRFDEAEVETWLQERKKARAA